MMMLIIAALTAPMSVAEERSPVFIKIATCDATISSVVFSGLRDGIASSQKYRLVKDMTDEGRMDIVLTINMDCIERSDIAAIATVYGVAKCFGMRDCHHTFDGSSIRATLCDSTASAKCGRGLFKAFEDYVNNPIRPQLRVN